MRSLDSKKLKFDWAPGSFAKANRQFIKECSALYSEHYGMWSARSDLSGSVSLSPSRLEKLLDSDSARINWARYESTLVGYVISVHMKTELGFVSWVTQFVVHEDYRNQQVGKNLLYAVWQLKGHFAWGLLTPNPYAVRALEKATQRRCRPDRIQKNKRRLFRLGCMHVPYLEEYMELDVDSDRSRINTDFPVDHSDVPSMLQRVKNDQKPWLLGEIEDGWEWFAFTFSDQTKIRLSLEEVNSMLTASDQITQKAYSMMKLNGEHAWAHHTSRESSQIVDYCQLSRGQKVLDFGCGPGRHAIELAKSGIRVTGVDYNGIFVRKAQSDANQQRLLGTHFVEDDCRHVSLGECFDAALCLYDVVGTYVDIEENARIITNISNHLRPGAYALVSVMNVELTTRKAKHTFSIADGLSKLSELPISNAMESTGEIFDPDYYMLDSDNNVVYRREEFRAGGTTWESIVRDRRFSEEQIKAMCEEAGLTVVWTRFVRAGHWDEPLDKDDDRAKEILVLCRAASRQSHR